MIYFALKKIVNPITALVQDNSNVVLAIVDQTLLFDPPRINEAVAALKEGINTAPQPGTQLLFAHRLFHFMSECGQDPGRCVCVCLCVCVCVYVCHYYYYYY